MPEESKCCSKCGLDKPLSEYHDKKRKKQRKDGSFHYWQSKSAHCKACHYALQKDNNDRYADYYRKYRQDNKEKISEKTKAFYIRNMSEWWSILSQFVELKCSVCGYDKSSAALDFHHVNPADKESTVHKLMGQGNKPDEMSVARLKREVGKCIVLCANCHREHHSKYNFLEKITPKIADAIRK